MKRRMKKMKMNRKKALPVLALALACAVASAGCGGGSAGIAALADGEYHGVSSEDDNGAYGDITITIEGGAVTGCVYVTYEKDGGIKGEDYGKVNGEISNPDYYQKAQLAVDAMQAYADELARTGDPQEVDAISGATNSYDQFQEAAADALRG